MFKREAIITVSHISFNFNVYVVKAMADSLCFQNNVLILYTHRVKDAVLCRGRPSLRPPAARSSRDPAAHDNGGVITPTPPHKVLSSSPSPLLTQQARDYNGNSFSACCSTATVPTSMLPTFPANSHRWCRFSECTMKTMKLVCFHRPGEKSEENLVASYK